MLGERGKFKRGKRFGAGRGGARIAEPAGHGFHGQCDPQGSRRCVGARAPR